MPNLEKYLGIDYGTKRIGFALADEETRLATPHAVYPASEDIVERILDLCREQKITRIVVGVPLNFQMQSTPQTRLTLQFVEKLRQVVSCPVETENEIFTSKISRAAGSKHIDASSATLILQGWMDRVLGKKTSLPNVAE